MISAPKSFADCSRSWRKSKASRSYMQPVQDLTVEDRVSRTQYQYTSGRPGRQRTGRYGPEAVDKLQALPELRDVASDQQNDGLRSNLVIDRDTASRLGITPQDIDDALYDAFGQRQVSTIFTQLNQYHVVLEVEAQNSRRSPTTLKRYLHSSSTGDAGAVELALRACRQPIRPACHQSPGTISRGHVRLTWRRASLGEAVEASRSEARDGTARQHRRPRSRERRRLSKLR